LHVVFDAGVVDADEVHGGSVAAREGTWGGTGAARLPDGVEGSGCVEPEVSRPVCLRLSPWPSQVRMTKAKSMMKMRGVRRFMV
jgi:hypothetical protein